jgi:hypothetical protein
MKAVTFSIAGSATVSGWVQIAPSRLEALVLPTLDSTTIQFEVSVDGVNSLGVVNKAVDGSAIAALTMGTANTGGVVQIVPLDVAAISEGPCLIRLKVAAQTGGARTVTGLCSAGKGGIG